MRIIFAGTKFSVFFPSRGAKKSCGVEPDHIANVHVFAFLVKNAKQITDDLLMCFPHSLRNPKAILKPQTSAFLTKNEETH